MLNVENVIVRAAGAPTDFERLTVRAAMNDAVRSFMIELAEEIPGEWKYKPGTHIEITANGDLLVEGYVNAYQAAGDPKSHRIVVQGRSKGQDFVDSSAEHDTGFFENMSVADMAKAINRHGIKIDADIPLDKIPYAQLKPGEKCFQFCERYLRGEGATIMGLPNGDMRITNASKAPHHFGILWEGPLGNIKSFDVDHNDGSRHSHYNIKGQSRRGTGAASLRVKETARDGGVKRHRPRTIASETDTDPSRARKRAHHEKERAAGQALRGAVATQGFRDFAGLLFEPGRLIYVHSPRMMKLSMTMLIESVQFSIDRSGSQTRLGLVDPRAYKGKGPAKSGAGAAGAARGIDPEAQLDDAETDEAWTLGYEESGGQ